MMSGRNGDFFPEYHQTFDNLRSVFRPFGLHCGVHLPPPGPTEADLEAKGPQRTHLDGILGHFWEDSGTHWPPCEAQSRSPNRKNIPKSDKIGSRRGSREGSRKSLRKCEDLAPSRTLRIEPPLKREYDFHYFTVARK